MNQEQRLERLLEVGRSMVSELDLETLLEHILEVARDLTGAQYAAMGVLDDDRVHLARFITAGIDPAAKAVIGDLPRGHGVLGELIRHPEPLRLEDVGSHPESYGFPVGHPPMHSFLGVPIVVRGEAWGNLYLTEKADGPFTAEDEHAIGILADWAAVAVGNARAYSVEHNRRHELERGVAAYEATLEIAKALAGETDLDRVLELVVKRGRALISARSMLIELIDGDEVVVVTTAGRLPTDLVGVRVQLGSSIAGHIARTRQSRRLADLSGGINFALRDRVPAEAGLFVPLLVRGRVIGVLAAFDRLVDGPDFDDEDERLMAAFATSAANAVATAQSATAEGIDRAMHAAEEERRRWARELHDDTLQDIGALRILLGAARQAGDPALLEQAVDEAIDRLAAQADVLRALITDLHPAALEKLGVGPAIEALVERVRSRAELDVHVEVDLDYDAGRATERLAPEIELTVYRVIQEALTNVIRHAAATTVSLDVDEREHRVTIRVADDGRGFDASGDASGFGLVGMRERLARVAGRLTITSAPDEGTSITATVPVTRVGGDASTRIPA